MIRFGRPVSPDGTSVAAVDLDGRVHLVSVQDGAVTPASGIEPGETPIAWSSDSRSVYVFRRGDIPARIVRVDTATGRRTLWKELKPQDETGVVTLSSVVMTPDERAYAFSYMRVLSELYVVDGVK